MSTHQPLPRTFVYIDGFNFYYAAYKKSPQYKWLNFDELFRRLLPNNDIQAIKYFTAYVIPRSTDPQQSNRQQVYLRALKTLPNCTIVTGKFLSHARMLPLAAGNEVQQPIQFVRVMKTEEKGSDVNLATHLLWDGFQDLYDVAVVVSNDSDLLLPIQIVRGSLGKKVGLVLHKNHRVARALKREADFIRRIRPGLMARCQFPDRMSDANGEFYRPSAWP